MTIDFSKSGVPRAANAFTLRDLQETCVAKGFKKADADASKPLAQVADVHTFFTSLGVTSMSTFKKRFNEEKLPDPYPGMTPLIAEKDKPKVEKITWDVPDVSEYYTLAGEWENMKWKLLPKPGGAVMKPEDWYKIWAAQQQVEKGDNPEPQQPMWAETGGMDFTGREKWKAWMALRGADVHQAKEAFCQSYGRAMAPERKEINFRKYG